MRRSIFLFFLVLFLASTAGHIYTIDSYLNYAATKSIGSYHKLSMPRSMMTVEGRGGRHYSKLGAGQSLANLPMYYLGGLVEMLSPGETAFKAYSEYVYFPHDGRLVKSEAQTIVRISEMDGGWVFFTSLTNAFVVAAACLLFFMLLRGFGVCAARSFLGTLILGFATPFWVYARDLFGEPLFAMSLLGAFYFLACPGKTLTPKRAMWAGAFSAVGILTRMSFAPIVAIFALFVVLSSAKKRGGFDLALRYIGLSLVGAVAVGILNWVRFESLFASGYHTAFDKGFSVPLIKGVIFNLFSPYRSIFLYAPPVILFFFGAAYFAKKHRARFVLILAIVAYMFALYSRWWAWHGGWCWGPRFYLPVIPLLILPGLVYIRLMNKRNLWPVVAALAVAGFVVQLGAVFINYTTAYDYWIKIGRLDWAEADIFLLSPITTHWKAILSTSPAQYDIWLIQAAREAGPVMMLPVILLAAAGVLLGRRVKKEIDRDTPGDCVG
jgi:hypothetical protein